MAEAMCGPSNALQQFKQRTDVDRTLQQDRLSSRHHSAAQSFRSHDSNAATLLDPQFEAFQAGSEVPVLDHAQAPLWASDFQRLNISSPAPQPVQQHLRFQPAPSSSSWANDFRQHVSQAAPRAQTSSPSPLAFQQRARGFGNFGFQGSFAQPAFTPAVQSKGKQPVLEDEFDEAAFDRAFDQAREDMMADIEDPSHAETIEEIVQKVEAAAQREATSMLNGTDSDMEDGAWSGALQRLHSSDIEHQPQQEAQQEQVEDTTQQQQDDDALAATAQELLEKVEHNQSDKFKNSQFLGLMRKLRDREVRVEGDKMVETADVSSTSVEDATLNPSSSSTSSQRVYYGKPQPFPLAAPAADTRSHEMLAAEQDHDPGRINPNDGQEVIDLLNQRGPVTDDMDSEFLMTSPFYQP